MSNAEQDGARILAIVGPQIARFAVPPPRKHDIEPDDGVVVAYRPWGHKERVQEAHLRVLSTPGELFRRLADA